MTTTENSVPKAAGAGHAGPRLDFAALAPEVYRAMVKLDAASRRDVDPALAELVRVRASQLNGCAFCVDMHTRDARQAGESEQRLHLVAAWEEAGEVFTDRERAALALTEAVTVLTDGFVPDAVYQRAAAHFSEEELAALITLATTINAWNRIGVSTRMTPGRA
ncbi:carboxymuconolactone decarboxylase family protein [Streptomyces sp. NPDC059740]|uniref:carboxymuconolactone decarboxylase family protein n=1 Tax=Streptomyces sp. NPDC059740 TaxID=3346926 RepID=UPI0036627CD7